MLYVIPVSEGETHTIITDPIGEYVEGQEGITLDQLKELANGNIEPPNTDIIDNMTPTERYLWLVEDVGYYTFSALAIVKKEKVDFLEEAMEGFDWPDSSSPYEMFNKMIIGVAEKTIPFYNKGIIEIDPDY